MPRIQFNNEITWGHLLHGFTMLMAAVSLYYGVQSKITAESYERSVADRELHSLIAETARVQRENIESLRQLEAWKSGHQSEWDRHLGEYNVHGSK